MFLCVFAPSLALFYTNPSSLIACFHVSFILPLSVSSQLSSSLHFLAINLSVFLVSVSFMSALALGFTFSASSLGLCLSPVSMTQPLLCLCSFIISLSDLLSLSQSVTCQTLAH